MLFVFSRRELMLTSRRTVDLCRLGGCCCRCCWFPSAATPMR